MRLSGWGQYPVIEAKPLVFADERSLARSLGSQGPAIPFGNGRSYGDSALAGLYIPVRPRDRMLSFDPETGLLTCEAGVLLSEIVETFLPRGWFLKVTPGTKLITVGGAAAADVHGKNHHVAGCFGDTVHSLRLMLGDGRIVHCSREENRRLFLATCGGMGLTGVILEVSFYLERVRSSVIEQGTIKTASLMDTFEAFEEYRDWPYSVAWIDCLASKRSLGRALLMVGKFVDMGGFDYTPAKMRSVPCNFPGFVLNKHSVRVFNSLYYARVRSRISLNFTNVDSFFYPLDAINHWNRIYGRRGFVQYQFILPKRQSYSGLEKILKKTSECGMGSFLAVLKLHGPANDNYLSFPMEGYSLALDFKMQPGLFAFLDRLDEIVLEHGGRMYLAKDARVSREAFEQGYPCLPEFCSLRKEYGLQEKFESIQSRRLGL
ncbi:MAG: FAD-dependent oxidoreductase [Desulfonatronovibrionaceae bacterium]